jgi:hypothetical protein
VYSHCNICNIPIYFYNIHIKHLQHISKTPETYAYYMRRILVQPPPPFAVGRRSRSRSEAGGLPHQGTALLLAPAATMIVRGRHVSGVVVGVGAPHAHDMAMGPGGVAGTVWARGGQSGQCGSHRRRQVEL